MNDYEREKEKRKIFEDIALKAASLDMIDEMKYQKFRVSDSGYYVLRPSVTVHFSDTLDSVESVHINYDTEKEAEDIYKKLLKG